MGRILKNLKPHKARVLAIVLLLIFQAFCDLALPSQTSNLIDVGIQNGGVAHIMPEKMVADEYEQAQIFMSEDEKELWTSLYTQEGDLYVLTEKNEKRLEEADETLVTAIALTYNLGHTEESSFKKTIQTAMAAKSDNPQAAAIAEKIPDMSLEEIGAMFQMDITSFDVTDDDGNVTTYVDMRPLMQAMIASGQMDASGIETAKDTMNKTIETLGSSTIRSMGIRYAVSCDETAGMDMDKVQMAYLWKTAGIMALYALGAMLAAVAAGYISSHVAAAAGRDLRGRVFNKVMSFSNAEIDKFSSASLITRATNDVQQIQMVTVLLLRLVLYAPIIGIGGVLRVSQTGANMSWIIALAVLILVGFMMLLVAVAMPKFKVMQDKVDSMNRVSREILTGLSVIRAFGREKTEEERFDDANIDLKRTQLFTNRVMTFMMPGMMMVMNCITVLITWVSAKHIDAGTLQVGAMTAFITYALQIVIAFLMMTSLSIMLPRASVAAERIDAVLHTDSSILSGKEAKNAENCKGLLAFNHVSFRYPGAEENVLTDINFVAEPGKTTAIIGSTGCGKSSLVNLIPRFFDVTEGSITLDGVDVRELDLKSLRANVGFVPQKGVLFSGTIASNLRFGNADAAQEEIETAAAIAQAEDFIEEKNDKYESFIAQEGRNVSGGQKQRLAIARAIAKNPPVYVFDDSFSALDMKTDAKLRKALAEKVSHATQIVVAQRISTIMEADQILVLDEGRLAGKGTHKELMETCEVYRQIATSQLSRKELGLSEEV